MNAMEAHVRCVFVLHVLNSTSPFYAADCKATRVCEARDHAGLPFQIALHCLVEFHWVAQVDDVAVAVGGANDEELVFDVHGVDALLTINCSYG